MSAVAHLLTVNAMAAIGCDPGPLQCEFFALEDIAIAQRWSRCARPLNPNRRPWHRADHVRPRNNLRTSVAAFRQIMGAKVYNTMIPRNVRISEAPSTASRCGCTISNASAANLSQLATEGSSASASCAA